MSVLLVMLTSGQSNGFLTEFVRTFFMPLRPESNFKVRGCAFPDVIAKADSEGDKYKNICEGIAPGIPPNLVRVGMGSCRGFG